MAQVQGIYGVGNVGGSKKNTSNPLLNMGNSGWKPGGAVNIKKPNDFAPTIPTVRPGNTGGSGGSSTNYSGSSGNYSGGGSS